MAWLALVLICYCVLGEKHDDALVLLADADLALQPARIRVHLAQVRCDGLVILVFMLLLPRRKLAVAPRCVDVAAALNEGATLPARSHLISLEADCVGTASTRR